MSMKKLTVLIMVFVLMLTGCSIPFANSVSSTQEDEDEEEMFDLVLDSGFESDKTSYAEGERVKIYYDMIATDMDYSFYTDSVDVELKTAYDPEKGYILKFRMPDHDVAVHVSSRNTMENTSSGFFYMNPFEGIPDDDGRALMDYIGENVSLMGTMVANIYEYDVTGDGYDDLCASVYTGSGIVSILVVVYDLYNDQGYMLDNRMVYDYWIEGVVGNKLVVDRVPYRDQQAQVYGTVVVENGRLVYKVDEDNDILTVSVGEWKAWMAQVAGGIYYFDSDNTLFYMTINNDGTMIHDNQETGEYEILDYVITDSGEIFSECYYDPESDTFDGKVTHETYTITGLDENEHLVMNIDFYDINDEYFGSSTWLFEKEATPFVYN